MYNGIGLQTPRGSGTSGYVQANKFKLKHRHGPIPTKEFQEGQGLGGVTKRANKDILEHERKRQIELKLIELRDLLENQGYSEEEIQAQEAEARMQLEEEAVAEADAGTAVESNKQTSHQIAAAKERKMEEMKAALGIGDRKEGEAFDRELQEQKRQERMLIREQKEKESEMELLQERKEATRLEKERRREEKRREKQRKAEEKKQRKRKEREEKDRKKMEKKEREEERSGSRKRHKIDKEGADKSQDEGKYGGAGEDAKDADRHRKKDLSTGDEGRRLPRSKQPEDEDEEKEGQLERGPRSERQVKGREQEDPHSLKNYGGFDESRSERTLNNERSSALWTRERQYGEWKGVGRASPREGDGEDAREGGYGVRRDLKHVRGGMESNEGFDDEGLELRRSREDRRGEYVRRQEPRKERDFPAKEGEYTRDEGHMREQDTEETRVNIQKMSRKGEGDRRERGDSGKERGWAVSGGAEERRGRVRDERERAEGGSQREAGYGRSFMDHPSEALADAEKGRSWRHARGERPGRGHDAGMVEEGSMGRSELGDYRSVEKLKERKHLLEEDEKEGRGLKELVSTKKGEESGSEAVAFKEVKGLDKWDGKKSGYGDGSVDDGVEHYEAKEEAVAKQKPPKKVEKEGGQKRGRKRHDSDDESSSTSGSESSSDDDSDSESGSDSQSESESDSEDDRTSSKKRRRSRH